MIQEAHHTENMHPITLRSRASQWHPTFHKQNLRIHNPISTKKGHKTQIKHDSI